MRLLAVMTATAVRRWKGVILFYHLFSSTHIHLGEVGAEMSSYWARPRIRLVLYFPERVFRSR